ncbi:SDR family NAD(P)-dependent oxidoreductase [Flavobacterium sp. FlaQc-52]|jgi:short-subunit dehydrogenase|uniref:SDR family NAD(P)-dependent oxidoreductase n=1 Tax=Flavobacterium sp. FlaQc-52 TaxID=3374185 RepID=UPI003757F4D1
MKELYTVVTGASQGLGKSFAFELAQRNENLILVSLPNQNLRELCMELQSRFKIKIHSFEIDLTRKSNVLKLASWINDNFNLKMLINNAGIGGTKEFEKAGVHYLDNIIQLNVMATSLLTHQVLPNLQRHDKAYILNISSLAAFSPIAYKTVYPASKAFVYSFSRGLYEELKDTNVFVSVVNPGPMKTNDEVTKRIESQGFFAKMTSLDPDQVAVFCLNRLEKRDTVIMVNQFSWLFLKILPVWLKLPMLSNKIKKELAL